MSLFAIARPRSHPLTLGTWLVTQSCLLAGVGVGTARADLDEETVGSEPSGRATSHHIEAPFLPFRLEAHGALTWDGEFGIGARADIPILDDSATTGSRDQLCLTVGVDAVFVAFEGSDPRTFWPTVGVQWTLGITDQFSFYPELGLAALIERDGWQGVLPNIGFGGRYHFYRSIALFGRLGWPMALSLGVTF